MAVLECVDSPELASLEYDQRVDKLAGRYGEDLLLSLQCLRTLQLEIRLFGHDEMRYGELPEPIIVHVLNAMNCHDIQALVEKVEQALVVTSALIDDFFTDLNWSNLADWKETRVTWL
jgi:hypothetical protein